MISVIHHPNPSRKCEQGVKELLDKLKICKDTIEAVEKIEEALPRIIEGVTFKSADQLYHIEYEDNGADFKLFYQETDLVAEVNIAF